MGALATATLAAATLLSAARAMHALASLRPALHRAGIATCRADGGSVVADELLHEVAESE